MNAAYIRTLVSGQQSLVEDAANLEGWWKAFFGEQPQFKDYIDDFPHVFQALMDTPLQPLKEKTIRELIPFTADDDIRIRAAVKYLLTGQNQPQAVRPRHCISASRLAVTKATAQPDTLVDQLRVINERTAALVRDNAAPGLRASDDSVLHQKFIASFADLIGNIG
jgi:hypothetical protein